MKMLHVKRDDPLEKVIRPIVEGQIRGFLKEHPVIVEAVNWYKPRKDKATTLVNSMSKRIVRDMVCQTTRDRIEDALMEIWESERNSDVACAAAPDGVQVGITSDLPPFSRVEGLNCGERGLLGIASEQPDADFHSWFGN